MKFSKGFTKRSKRNSSGNHTSTRSTWGRVSRMESLEDRRVLATYFVNGNGDSIQDAVDNAQNNGVEDTIFLLSDTYTQNVEIQDNDRLTIIGLGNVILKPDDNGDNNHDSSVVSQAFTSDSDDTFSIHNSKHVTLKNLKFKYAEDDAIDVQNTYKISLYDVQALDGDDDGLDAENVNYIFIHNSRFNNNDDNGIELRNVGYAYLRDVQASYNGHDDDDGDRRDSGVNYINEHFNDTIQLEGATTNGNDNGFNVFAGHLEVYSGDFSKNGGDGIYTDGVEIVEIDTIYANDNEEDGVDVEDDSQAAKELSIHYAAMDSNGDDGVESDAEHVWLTTIRANHNDDEGLDIDEAEDVYIHNADFSYNGEEGLDIDSLEKLTIDYIQAIGNGGNPNEESEGGGLNVDNVDEVSINDSQFISNFGDGININMNEHGETEITWVDSSYNWGDGIDLRDGSAWLDGVNTSNNDRNGIRTYNLKYLSINNTSSTYNSRNGLLIEGGSNDVVVEEGINGNGSHYQTDADISWSEFALNYEDGIHANNAGEILLDRISVTYNGDDGFQSFFPEESAEVIDSIFENNFDEDFEEIFF